MAGGLPFDPRAPPAAKTGIQTQLELETIVAGDTDVLNIRMYNSGREWPRIRTIIQTAAQARYNSSDRQLVLYSCYFYSKKKCLFIPHGERRTEGPAPQS